MALEDEGALGLPRIPLAALPAHDPYVASVFAPMLEEGNEPPTLYRALGVSPAMLRAWRGMSLVLLEECTSPARVRELAILRIAQVLDCGYQFEHHLSRASTAGVTPEQIASLSDWRNASVYADDERAVLAMTEESTADARVSAVTAALLRAHFEPAEIVEITLIVAFYNAVCRVVGTLFDA
jgi:AhpD family alkylhydroperoxidase